MLQANPSVDVPAKHWSYDAIEKLAIIGLCDIADIGVRPASRIKMAYIVKSAVEKSSDYDLDFDWGEQEYLEELLYRLIDEFREELVTIGVEVVSIQDESPAKYRLSSPELNVEKIYTKLDSERELFENNDGWKLRDGLNIRARLTSWAKIANFFAVSLTPGVRFSKEDADFDLENAHLRLAHPSYNMELSAGRSSMWWGPGFYGSLLMSNNAYPLDTVRWNNIYPFRLPWILRKIGRFNALFMVSRLEEKRDIPHTFLTGWRVDYTPWDFLKFGFGHILMHGGKGVERLDFKDYWASASLALSAAGGGSETENHIISGDMQLFLRRIDRFLPIATGIKLYTEWGAEDESGNVPTNLATVTGAYFTDVFKIPGFDGKIEFSKLSSIWYTHFRYSSGYTHRGSIIGHRAGGDSDSIAVSGIFNYPDKYSAELVLSYERRGLSLANIERTGELRLNFGVMDALTMYNIHNIEINVFYIMQDIKNYDNTTTNLRNHVVGLEAKRRF